MKFASVALGAIAAFAFASASQAAVTYNLAPETDTSCCAAGTIDVTGTITTNGATGVLTAADILGWSITLSEAGHVNEYLSSATNAIDLSLSGADLTATSTGLYWHYGNGAAFSIAPAGPPTTQWHLYTNRSDVDFNGVEYANYQYGNTLIGSAVPEPSVWAMMLLGLGGLGMVLRSRRRPYGLAATA